MMPQLVRVCLKGICSLATIDRWLWIGQTFPPVRSLLKCFADRPVIDQREKVDWFDGTHLHLVDFLEDKTGLQKTEYSWLQVQWWNLPVISPEIGSLPFRAGLNLLSAEERMMSPMEQAVYRSVKLVKRRLNWCFIFLVPLPGTVFIVLLV